MQPDLLHFLKKLGNLGFLVKLDTNGYRPDIINAVLEADLIDYIAMDVKAPLDKYNLATGIRIPSGKIRQSIDLIRDSGLDHEFRTTIVPGLHNREDIEEILGLINGSRRYALQTFQSNDPLEPAEAQLPPAPWRPTQTWLHKNSSQVDELLVR